MTSRSRGARRPTRPAVSRAPDELPPPYALPAREWHRGVELIRMFVATGFIANGRPQSVLFVSEPGSGKTELLDLFKPNAFLSYASDITSRGLHPILKLAQKGSCTHLVATEFQKLFMRKSSTASATLGVLCQAMEEGVGRVLIGDQEVDFGGAKLGVIAAITHDTAAKWKSQFRELGFWSRCAAFEWEVPTDELRDVMRSITRGDRNDLAPILLDMPRRKVHVDFPERLSEQFEDFVFQRFREHTLLRVFNRFRTLAMACALLDGRDVVSAYDVERVVAFQPYWDRMIR